MPSRRVLLSLSMLLQYVLEVVKCIGGLYGVGAQVGVVCMYVWRVMI